MVGVIATFWGFAEATLFFIVPDVYLSLVAIRDTKAGLVGCLFAVGGALLGGAVMYMWGSLDVLGAQAALNVIPEIDAQLIAEVRASLTESGLAAVFEGPLLGTPYKIYAVESGGLKLGMLPFLLISVPARALRFVLITGLAAFASHKLFPGWPLGRKR